MTSDLEVISDVLELARGKITILTIDTVLENFARAYVHVHIIWQIMYIYWQLYACGASAELELLLPLFRTVYFYASMVEYFIRTIGL